MPLQTANWEPNKDMPVGKGATVQQFFTTLGKDQFEINVAPWGEGQLKVNGQEIARTAEEGPPPGVRRLEAGCRKVRSRRTP